MLTLFWSSQNLSLFICTYPAYDGTLLQDCTGKRSKRYYLENEISFLKIKINVKMYALSDCTNKQYSPDLGDR